MKNFYAKVYNLLNSKEEGATMVEYALMVGLIACVCIAVVTTLGTDIQSLFAKLGGSVTGATANVPAAP